jgi:hypothetical protein
MVNVERAVGLRTPVFLRFGNGGAEVAGGSDSYFVEDLVHGLQIAEAGRRAAKLGSRADFTPAAMVKTTHRIRPLAEARPPAARDYPPLPPVEEWVSARRFDARGDGETDDTEALRKAVAASRVVYLPFGVYRVTDTIELRPDSVLIGLHPARAVLSCRGPTPGFTDAQKPKPVLQAPKGGRTFVTGVGLRILGNAGAVGIRWMAGPESCLDDVWIDPLGRPDPQPTETHHSIWVCDGGGGTLKNIWSANPTALSGLCVADTPTPGRVYQMSIEHHRRVELAVERAADWAFYAVQTEEAKASPETTAIEIVQSQRLRFANLFCYRTITANTGHPYAVRVESGEDLVFRGLHVFSWGAAPFTNSLFDVPSENYLRHREAARVGIRTEP